MINDKFTLDEFQRIISLAKQSANQTIARLSLIQSALPQLPAGLAYSALLPTDSPLVPTGYALALNASSCSSALAGINALPPIAAALYDINSPPFKAASVFPNAAMRGAALERIGGIFMTGNTDLREDGSLFTRAAVGWYWSPRAGAALLVRCDLPIDACDLHSSSAAIGFPQGSSYVDVQPADIRSSPRLYSVFWSENTSDAEISRQIIAAEQQCKEGDEWASVIGD